MHNRRGGIVGHIPRRETVYGQACLLLFVAACFCTALGFALAVLLLSPK